MENIMVAVAQEVFFMKMKEISPAVKVFIINCDDPDVLMKVIRRCREKISDIEHIKRLHAKPIEEPVVAQEVEPVTIETMRRLSGADKYFAQWQYRNWQEKVRKEDRKEVLREHNKILNFKNKEKNKEYQKAWYQRKKREERDETRNHNV